MFGTSLLLKNKQAVFESKNQAGLWKRYVLEFFIVGVVGIAVFGALSVTDFTWQSVGERMWKVLVVYWDSLLICLPSLFVFSIIRGSRITLAELLFYVVGAMAIIGVVLLSIAPIIGFFAWTTDIPETMQFISVVVGGIALIFGINYIGQGYTFIHGLRPSGDMAKKLSKDFLLLWFILLAAVMLQMANQLGLLGQA
ncbi:MAG: hypothetical protein HZC01_04500 [Candidatus Kerfeldbacteria bacterium]|nr:hypothetical protein [Candidatus Kerfeldbacteria bacterium]